MPSSTRRGRAPQDPPSIIIDASASSKLLAEHAGEIRLLRKRVADDLIEIGRRLTVSQKLVGHGNWLPWLEREFGWTDDTALNFMHVYEMSKSRNFRDLSLPVSSLYLLAKPSTPEEARDAVFDRAANGERPTCAQVRATIAEAKGSDIVTGVAILPHAERKKNREPDPEKVLDNLMTCIEQAINVLGDDAFAFKSVRQRLIKLESERARDRIAEEAELSVGRH